MTIEQANQLSPAAREMAKNILPLREPSKRTTDRAAEVLNNCGWSRELAGETNFSRGVRAIAQARENHKGLVISGEVGTGKTSFMRCFPSLGGRPIKLIDLRNATQLHWLNREEYPEVWKVYENCHVWLDDVGAEPTGNSYGRIYEPVLDFIDDFRANCHGNIFITTNLYLNPPSHIEDPAEAARLTLEYRYGRRIDSLKECVIFTEFTRNPLLGNLRQEFIVL